MARRDRRGLTRWCAATSGQIRSDDHFVEQSGLDMLTSNLSGFAPQAVFGSAVLSLTARWKHGIIPSLHE
jgi:hypothetical protein